jgi:hypothetical protein
VVYAECLCDVEAALDLLARHIVDQRALIFYSAIGDGFRRTCSLTPQVKKCENFS